MKRFGALAIVLLLLAGVVAVGVRAAARPVFFPYSPRLGWVPGSNLDDDFYGTDYTAHIRTDEHGYRLGPRGPVDFDDNLVLFIGDSFVFGWGVSDDETFAARFDELLETKDESYRVVNLGVPGYGTLEMAERLDEFLETFGVEHVRAIFAFHHFNDQRGNLRFIQFRQGFMAPQPSSSSLRKGLVSLIDAARSAAGDSAPRHAPDVLIASPLQYVPGKTGNLTIDGDWQVPSSDIDIFAQTKQVMWDRPFLPPIPRRLTVRGIERINRATDRPVWHLTINYAPDWFENAIRECFNEAGPGEQDVFLGAVPTAPEFNEHMLNTHSGSHFTPEYSRHYAEVLFDMVKDDLFAGQQR